jgi:pimeloyl-ACP methyl ester carboxylesterase
VPEFDFKGLRASYLSWGNGQPIVLLHGGGASAALWT